MTSHLISVALGPVQTFIAAARRTRDLWYGSYLLSELAKGAARSLNESGVRLIAPAPENPSRDLAPGTDFNVPNLLLGALPAGEPAPVVDRARAAVEARWADVVADAYRRVSDAIDPETWRDQEKGVVEFYAAWVSATGDYKADRARLAHLLAGRKALRDFAPASGHGDGKWKSSLDGARETVLVRDLKGRKGSPTLRLGRGEELDLVGVVKRVAGGDQPFPSLTRIAADAWVRAAQVEAPAALAALRAASAPIANRGLGSVKGKAFEAFPFSGSLLYETRHAEVATELDLAKEEFVLVRQALGDLRKRLGEPSPYVALLQADGDRVGAALSEMKTVEDHEKFSRALSTFATAAKATIEEHSGACVYAGGDDVLAALPLDGAIPCAHELSKRFGRVGHGLTLSVGVGIGHFMEPMEDLLHLAREAEKAAKHSGGMWTGEGDRNGLAIAVSPRGGSLVTLRDNWSPAPGRKPLHERLAAYADMMGKDEISTKLGYDLRALALDYEAWTDATETGRAIGADLARILKRKDLKKEAELLDKIGGGVANARQLQARADELVVAARLGRHLAASGIFTGGGSR